MQTMWTPIAVKPKRGEDVEEDIRVTMEQDQNTVLNVAHMLVDLQVSRWTFRRRTRTESNWSTKSTKAYHRPTSDIVTCLDVLQCFRTPNLWKLATAMARQSIALSVHDLHRPLDNDQRTHQHKIGERIPCKQILQVQCHSSCRNGSSCKVCC